MIAVSFFSEREGDVCGFLEAHISLGNSITEWICLQIPTLDFDCMDFPADTEDFYISYFRSSNENADIQALNKLFSEKLDKFEYIKWEVYKVDNQFNKVGGETK